MDIVGITVTQGILATLFVVTCVLLILVVLLQKGRGGGLAGAFGGAGGHSAFGAKTGDVFTWVTVGLTFLYVSIAVIGNYQFVPQPVAGGADSHVQSPAESPADEGAPVGGATPSGAGPSEAAPSRAAPATQPGG